jgi:two-component system sensor kinase
MNMARYQVAASRYHLGDLPGAHAEARRMHQSGLELGDIQASGLSVDILSKSARGNVSESICRTELDRPRGDDAQTTSQVLQGEGVRLVAQGNFREAAQVFERGFAVAYRAGVRHTYIFPCLPWLATALRREAERLRGRDPAESHRLLRRARQAANRGVRLARKFRNDLPHALREQGLLAAASGRLRRARRCLEESLRVADRQGARYEYAQTLLALGQTKIQQGALEGHQQVAEAQAMLEAITGDTPSG